VHRGDGGRVESESPNGAGLFVERIGPDWTNPRHWRPLNRVDVSPQAIGGQSD